VTAGAGFYFVRELPDNAPDPDSDTRGGINFGGGVEYFVHRTMSLKGEGRYHAIQDFPGIDPSGLVLSVGLKTYF